MTDDKNGWWDTEPELQIQLCEFCEDRGIEITDCDVCGAEICIECVNSGMCPDCYEREMYDEA